MGSSARLRFWCEDRSQEAFVRSLFKKLWGVDDRRQIYVNAAPEGKGAASQWVIAQYAQVRKELRATRNQTALGFLVVVDGDNVGLQKRLETLEQTAEKRDPEDRLAIFVPTWNIETWVLWLTEQAVNETRSFKPDLPATRFREMLPLAIENWKPVRADEKENVPSLCHARSELSRLPR